MDKGWEKGLKITGGVLVGVAAVAAAPFTGGGSILAGAASLGLGTAVAAGSAAAAGIAGGALANMLSEDTEDRTSQSGTKRTFIKRGIVILGPTQVGKTTIYNFLKGENKSGATSVEDYEQFKYKIGNGLAIIIRKGKDIGGKESFINNYYEKMITSNKIDYCFFVFNAFEYLNNTDHQRDVNARLHFICKKNKKIKLIGSFIDNFSQDEQHLVSSKIQELNNEKPYKSMFGGRNFSLLNLTDQKQLSVYLKKVFIKTTS